MRQTRKQLIHPTKLIYFLFLKEILIVEYGTIETGFIDDIGDKHCDSALMHSESVVWWSHLKIEGCLELNE